MKFREYQGEGFEGVVLGELRAALEDGRLRRLRDEVWDEEARVLAAGRHRVVVLEMEIEGRLRMVAVKAFGRQQWWKNRYDRRRGSKAARSFEAARFLVEKGVSTPAPLGYLDRWEGGDLCESYYFSDFLDGLTSLKDELNRLYERRGTCADVVAILERVGREMRKMHDAGFFHRDLGNQNMELLPGSGGEVHVIDLNRGRWDDLLGLRKRAMDFARLRLPSAFLEILVKIYWEARVPTEFWGEMKKHRRRFQWWQRSRMVRHPIKSFRKARKLRRSPLSRLEDLWIWDDRSAQAAITLDKVDRKKCHSWWNHCRVVVANLKALPRVWGEYRRQLEGAFTERVNLADRIGMSLEPADLEFGPQVEFLKQLGRVPVLLRFGHHEGRKQWEKTLGDLNRLHDLGHAVMVAVLQDRRAVLEPGSWQEFLEFLFEGIDGKVELVEVCHVVNRVKWGIHNLGEYRALMRPLVELRKRYSGIRLSGPSCIDFEMHYTVAALDSLPKGLRLDSLSHHLYVDRRRAPENKQGKFGVVEKAALLKAIAVCSGRCGERVVVSEVNWPLENTGVWSPISASYLAPGSKGSKVHVNEEEYACFMLRYLVLTLCSGLVDRVYWWRLVAHGFGLIDERAEGGWRPRKGFEVLVVFLRELGAATFVEKLEIEEDVYAFRFERAADEVTMMWCNGRVFEGPWPVGFTRVLNDRGEEADLTVVGESPFYLIG